jgi:hypothetical protein
MNPKASIKKVSGSFTPVSHQLAAKMKLLLVTAGKHKLMPKFLKTFKVR